MVAARTSVEGCGDRSVSQSRAMVARPVSGVSISVSTGVTEQVRHAPQTNGVGEPTGGGGNELVDRRGAQAGEGHDGAPCVEAVPSRTEGERPDGQRQREEALMTLSGQ